MNEVVEMKRIMKVEECVEQWRQERAPFPSESQFCVFPSENRLIYANLTKRTMYDSVEVSRNPMFQ